MSEREKWALELIGATKAVARLQLAGDLLDDVYKSGMSEIMTGVEKTTISDLLHDMKGRAMEMIRWNEQLLAGDLVRVRFPLGVEDGD